jgi:hypothetical protein
MMQKMTPELPELKTYGIVYLQEGPERQKRPRSSSW